VNNIIPIIIIITVLIGGGIAVYFTTPSNDIATEILYKCNQGLEDSTLFLNAIIASDITLCNDNTFCKATINKDSSFCDADDTYCLAIVSNNPELCDDYHDECRAFITQDVTRCSDKLTNPVEQQRCIAFATRDSTYLTSEQAQRDCEDIGIVWKNDLVRSDCDRIRHEGIKQECIEDTQFT
jgi:hypothetical protein